MKETRLSKWDFDIRGLTLHFFHSRTRTCTLLHLALTVGFHFCLELGTIFEQLTSLPGCQWTRASWPPLSWRVTLSSGYPCWGWTNKTDALGPPSWNLHLMLAKFQRNNTQWTSTLIKSILNSSGFFFKSAAEKTKTQAKSSRKKLSLLKPPYSNL